MRAIIEIFLAIIFTIITGASVLNFSGRAMKKEALIKIQKGLPPLQRFTSKILNSN